MAFDSLSFTIPLCGTLGMISQFLWFVTSAWNQPFSSLCFWFLKKTPISREQKWHLQLSLCKSVLLQPLWGQLHPLGHSPVLGMCHVITHPQLSGGGSSLNYRTIPRQVFITFDAVNEWTGNRSATAELTTITYIWFTPFNPLISVFFPDVRQFSAAWAAWGDFGFGISVRSLMGSACLPSMVLGCYHHILDLCKADPLICFSASSNTYSILACPHAWITSSVTDRALCPGRGEIAC